MSKEELPQWKRDLIRKKQSWKSQGGWSVPPLTTRRTLQIPVRFAFDNPYKTPNKSSTFDNSPLGGSVFDLTSTNDNDDDVFSLSKARSVDNILNEPSTTDPHLRRVSTSTIPSSQPSIDVRRRRRIGSTMEDFYRKYVKKPSTPVKTTTQETIIDKRSNVETRRKNGGDAPVYFYDLNYNELPPPNTVRQTIRVFENKELPPIKNGNV